MPPLKTDASHLHRAEHCLNCGTAVRANYCPNCGQETVLHVPSAGEFLHEFIGHYVALEGKLWKSLGYLLFRPGRLTREYLDGRRVRYVLPLRLYLTFSIIFFAVFKLGVHDVKVGGFDPGAVPEQPAAVAQQLQLSEADKAREAERDAERKARDAAREAERKERANKALIMIDANDREVGGLLVDALPKKYRDKLARLKDMPQEEAVRLATSAFFSYVPYAVFALMPVFALYLKLLYLGSGRRYGEHLLFALHSNAFAFLILSLMLLNPYPAVTGLLALWMVFYLPTAMRKVYGGSRLATFARWTVLGLLHIFTLVLTILVALAVGVALA